MSGSRQRSSDWRSLFRIACDLIGQVNRESLIIDNWTLGGGTAMMLHIDHRESRDIDIFLLDPQLLGFLNPETHDFSFEIMPDSYEGDGSRSIRFSFQGIGEIDFIAAPNLTAKPTIERDVEGTRILLETVPEIVTKKVRFRGTHIKPRDIFDIAAAGSKCRDEIVSALSNYPTEVNAALATMEKLNPTFVNAAISDLMIREKFQGLAALSIEKAGVLLRDAL